MEKLLLEILTNQKLIMKKLGIKPRKYNIEELKEVVKKIRKEK